MRTAIIEDIAENTKILLNHLQQYAIEGYSVRALDYVLKPVHYYSFASKMDQVMEILATRQKKKLIIHAQNDSGPSCYHQKRETGTRIWNEKYSGNRTKI